MDVIEILDDDHHISRHLSSLRIIQHNNPNKSSTSSSIIEASTSARNVTVQTTVQQAAKRSHIPFDDSLIGEFVQDTLQNAQNNIQTKCKSVSWDEQMDLHDAALKQKADKDIRNFIPCPLL